MKQPGVKLIRLKTTSVTTTAAINLRSRFKISHEDIDLSRFSMTYLVPKFHLPVHGPKCQTAYSFNYTHGVGRTHSETMEQEWFYINLTALSTREMGPGARHSTLDNYWGRWNWKKVLGLGKYDVHSQVPLILISATHRFIIWDEPHESSRNGIEATQDH